MGQAPTEDPFTEDSDKRVESFLSIFIRLFDELENDDKIPVPRKNHVKVAEYGNLHKLARIAGEAIIKFRGENNDDKIILPNLIEEIYQYLVSYQESHVQEAAIIINGIKDKLIENHV